MSKTAQAVVELPLDHIIREGRVSIGPGLAYRIMSEANYPRQRKLAPGHVALLAESMRRGNWMAGSQLAFGVLEGKLYLINGQHRLTAIFDSDRTCEFQVALLPVETEAALHQLYYRFDTEQRGRSLPEILNAVGFHETHGLTAGMAKCLYDASLFITTGFQHPASLKDPVVTRSRDARLAAAQPWGEAANAYEGLIEPAVPYFKRRLLNGQVAAVALVTIKHQPEVAGEFWGGVAKNDGLRARDPRHTLLRDFMSRDMQLSKSMVGCQVATQAWNAFYNRKDLALVRAYEIAPIRISGTPYDGRG